MGEVMRPKNNASYALQCRLCERQVVFKTRRHLYSHYSNIHYKEKLQSFVCPDKKNGCTICGKEFSSKQYLINHIGVSHNKLEDFIPSNFHVPKRSCEIRPEIEQSSAKIHNPVCQAETDKDEESPVLEDDPHDTSCEDMPTIIGVTHGKDDYHVPQTTSGWYLPEPDISAQSDPCDTSCEDVPTIMSVETVTTGETESDPDQETPDAGGSEQSSSKPMVIMKSDIEEIKSEGMSEPGSASNLRSYLDTDSEDEDD